MFGSTGADCIVIGYSGAISSKLYSIGVSNLLDFLFLGKESLDPIGADNLVTNDPSCHIYCRYYLVGVE